jgi:hypothetical protein
MHNRPAFNRFQDQATHQCSWLAPLSCSEKHFGPGTEPRSNHGNDAQTLLRGMTERHVAHQQSFCIQVAARKSLESPANMKLHPDSPDECNLCDHVLHVAKNTEEKP